MDVTDSARNPQQQQGQQPGSSTPSSQQQGGAIQSPRQQDQYSPTTRQQGGPSSSQGGAVAQRRRGFPSLWGRSPFELMRQMDEDMDRLWGELWASGRAPGRGASRSRGDLQQMWTPQLDVFEEGGKLHVHADLPGMKKEDIKVSVEQDQLVIQGERRSHVDQGDEQKGGYWHSERSYGSFYRTVPLPEGVDPSTADANFKDGVLDVCFDAPKQQHPQSRNIDVK